MTNAACIAEQEVEERLTRWRDPKTELPETDAWVLVKTEPGVYNVAYYERDCWWREDGSYNSGDIIGWREIHE